MSRRELNIVIAVLLVGIAICWPRISDALTIMKANPAMVSLAHEAKMTRKGELVFLKAKPQLVSDEQMTQDCPGAATASNNGFIEQGCFVPNKDDATTGRIYLRQMPSDLHELVVVTAAYEMLHPVYASLSSSALTSTIEANYVLPGPQSDTTLVSAVSEFAKTEPGARDDELFSLLATQDYGALTPSLQMYYSPYLSDPASVVSDNNDVMALFTSDQAQLATVKSNISTLDSQADTAYEDSVSWADAGNAYEDNYNYNIYTQDFNAENNAINQYNALLQTYNDLVAEYNGQQISPIQAAQSQGSQ